MDTHTEAQLYIADQRGYVENEGAIRFPTFNDAGYVGEGGEPFGPLLRINGE